MEETEDLDNMSDDAGEGRVVVAGSRIEDVDGADKVGEIVVRIPGSVGKENSQTREPLLRFRYAGEDELAPYPGKRQGAPVPRDLRASEER